MTTHYAIPYFNATAAADDVAGTSQPPLDAVDTAIFGARLTVPAAQPGRGGTIASGTRMTLQCGTAVGAINGAGYLDVVFPVPFAILGAVVTVAGDAVGTSQRAVAVSSPTAAGFSARVTDGAGAWVATGSSVRVDWIAAGSI